MAPSEGPHWLGSGVPRGFAALSLLSAVVGLVALFAVPMWGKLLAVGLGIFAVGGAVLTWRASRGARARLQAAAAATLGSMALAGGLVSVALTFAALRHLVRLFS